MEGDEDDAEKWSTDSGDGNGKEEKYSWKESNVLDRPKIGGEGKKNVREEVLGDSLVANSFPGKEKGDSFDKDVAALEEATERENSTFIVDGDGAGNNLKSRK